MTMTSRRLRHGGDVTRSQGRRPSSESDHRNIY